jgi:hypothetical protein
MIMKLIDLVPYVAPITIGFGFVFSLAIALRLYIDAPEKKEMGFNKYWHAFMLDASPGNEKKLLEYSDKIERYSLFVITTVRLRLRSKMLKAKRGKAFSGFFGCPRFERYL